MGKMKNLMITIEDMLREGFYPNDIVKLTGATMEMVLQAEEDLYQLGNPYNFGGDYE
jgi:hypothetical protein